MADSTPRPRIAHLSHLVVRAAAFVLLLALGACGSTGQASQSATTFTPTLATSTSPTPLPVDCPDAGQPAIGPDAHLRLNPTSGPVGTAVTVEASGLQAGCHLLLGLVVGPSLAETGGTPIAAPRQADEAIQWIAVASDGTVHTTFCVCAALPTYTVGDVGDSSYTSVTPVAGQSNVGAYGPRPGDYFFITVAGAGIPNPPPLYSKFTVMP
ncbi:MAG: hypothetical protein OJF49_002284 [Ktedonobacterales bacterium]|nr:MAG: hypothetical protein OJF49_002284 [Ktedonobacterales bacterium]